MIQVEIRIGRFKNAPRGNPPLSMSTDNKSVEEISFGEWLRQRRRMLDLTQQALADQVGCARITLRRIEAGALKPSKELVHILLEKLGIPETEHPQWILFARGLSGFPAKPSNAFTNKPLTNLLTSLTNFIGREKEQAEITKLIAKNRLVTLVGPGGMGKTSLSLQVGQKLLNDYPDGVWIVMLDSLTDPALVPQSVASVFDIQGLSESPIIEKLVFALRTKSTLLVMDNCEHLLESCAQLITTLLSNCPNLKILASSRESLGVAGEALYHVPSLALPDPQKLLEKFREYESVRLFEERAQLVQTNFVLTLENSSYVSRICHCLDVIPLAIELAAAHVNMLSTEQIAARLNENFNVLTSGGRLPLPRHQTLRASMDWSWNLLSDSERILLRRLSVFAGGWTREAAEAVCSAARIEPDLIPDLLSHLVNKSLVVVEPEGEESRYRLHETIRQYAREKLNDSGEMILICLRHLTFFAETVDEAQSNFKGPDQALWYNHLDNELDNLRVALTRFDGIENAEIKLRLAAGLWRYWKNRGKNSEGLGHLRRILEGMPPGPSGQTSAFARALTAAGALAYYEGDFSYSEETRKEALTIFRNLGDEVGIADCLNGLGNTSISQGNYDSARAFYAESIIIRKELDDKWGVARLLGNLGLLAYLQVDYIQARSIHLESIALFRELQDDESVANELVQLGDVVRCQGELSAANSLYEESAAIFKELKDHWGLAYAMMGIADVAFEQGDFSVAFSFYRDCLTRFQKGADHNGIPFVLESCAALELVKHRPEKAARIFGAADKLRKSTNSPLPLPNHPAYQKNLTILHQQLDPSMFAAAWANGQAMTMEQVVAYALKED